MQYKGCEIKLKNTHLPQESETSRTGCSLCVGVGVHLSGFGGLFPALISSIAEKSKISTQLCERLMDVVVKD